jgi:molecular chaperone HscB
MAEKVEATIQAITEAFSTDPPNFTQAKHLATQLRYWQGLEKAAREWSPSS